MEKDLVKSIVAEVISRMSTGTAGNEKTKPIPIGISNRHVHLSKSDLEILFGQGFELKCRKELSQPGQYAAHETVILAGPKGCIEQVRVLGPVRKQTQVEILRSDSFILGVKAPTRESGKLKGSCGITVIGPKGTVLLTEGVITAQRHIHMTAGDAALYGVIDGQCIKVKSGRDRGVVFDNVVVRVNDNFALECHIDMDEANAADLNNGDLAYLLVSTEGNCSTVAYASPVGNNSNPLENQDCTKGIKAGACAALSPLSLVTDEIVRAAWKSSKELLVGTNTLYTPLARDTIKELNITIKKCVQD